MLLFMLNNNNNKNNSYIYLFKAMLHVSTFEQKMAALGYVYCWFQTCFSHTLFFNENLL